MTASPSQTENSGIAARYAPPTFTSRDPLFEQKPWLTPYHYCSNNPVSRVDPTGCEFDSTQDFGSSECSNNNAGGLLSYGGIKDGKSLIIMHIGAKEAFSSSGIKLHELKHAYQYFEGRLGFFVKNPNTPSLTSNNNKVLEKEAHYRASAFSFSNTKSFGQYNFSVGAYKDIEQEEYHTRVHQNNAIKRGQVFINNNKIYDPWKR